MLRASSLRDPVGPGSNRDSIGDRSVSAARTAGTVGDRAHAWRSAGRSVACGGRVWGYFGLSILLALAPLACTKHEALQAQSAPSFAGPNTAGAGGATGAAGAAEAPPTEPVPPPARTRTEVRSGASAAAGSAAAAGSTATAGTTAIPEAGAGTGGTGGQHRHSGHEQRRPRRTQPVRLLRRLPRRATRGAGGGDGHDQRLRPPRTCTSPKLPSRQSRSPRSCADATALPLSSFAGCTTIDEEPVVDRPRATTSPRCTASSG